MIADARNGSEYQIRRSVCTAQRIRTDSANDGGASSVAMTSALAPAAVLERLHEVEAALGRRRGARWEPRVCDLDLIASGESVLPDAATVRDWMARAGARQLEAPPVLILPHPRLQERGFVLAPLAEVAPHWRHPLLGRTVREMLEALPPGAMEGIERL